MEVRVVFSTRIENKVHFFVDILIVLDSFKLDLGQPVHLGSGGAVLHMAYDPLPPGSYYYEVQVVDGVEGISVVTDSTLHQAYKKGSPTTEWDIESKIMFVSDTPVERPAAIVGDEVDAGVTTVQTGSPLGNIVVASIEHNISREGDALANGGNILTASWFVEMTN